MKLWQKDKTALKEVEKFIKTNKHLPGVPSAGEIENKAIDLGETQAILLKKIEELTLYIIQQNKNDPNSLGEIRSYHESPQPQPHLPAKLIGISQVIPHHSYHRNERGDPETIT